jgi:hypothetical protein
VVLWESTSTSRLRILIRTWGPNSTPRLFSPYVTNFLAIIASFPPCFRPFQFIALFLCSMISVHRVLVDCSLSCGSDKVLLGNDELEGLAYHPLSYKLLRRWNYDTFLDECSPVYPDFCLCNSNDNVRAW